MLIDLSFCNILQILLNLQTIKSQAQVHLWTFGKTLYKNKGKFGKTLYKNKGKFPHRGYSDKMNCILILESVSGGSFPWQSSNFCFEDHLYRVIFMIICSIQNGFLSCIFSSPSVSPQTPYQRLGTTELNLCLLPNFGPQSELKNGPIPASNCYQLILTFFIHWLHFRILNYLDLLKLYKKQLQRKSRMLWLSWARSFCTTHKILIHGHSGSTFAGN